MIKIIGSTFNFLIALVLLITPIRLMSQGQINGSTAEYAAINSFQNDQFNSQSSGNSGFNEAFVIPKPNKFKSIPGNVIIPDTMAIKMLIKSGQALELAEMFKEEFTKFTGKKAFLADNNYSGKPVLVMSINPKSGALGDEGYVLKIRNDSIFMEAQASQGLFYATRSLLQMLSAGQSAGSLILNNCIINDYPRYPWRGMNLDVSRHFFTKEFIFKYLDAMALHKLNVFHWHLTDDQGWRVEIKKYPKLTEICAWREDQEDKEWSYFQYPTNEKSKKLYGGFYTQDDIREIVKYATQYQILIVPEIDVPGHSTSAIYAYPELSCSKKPWVKSDRIPFEFSDPMCAGNEFTYQFLEDVFSELCELFPGPYFHIGGDECKHTTWEKCKSCQKRMADNNLKDVKELQSYFNQRLEVFLTTKHKRLIGWEEIAEGGISPSSMLMSWKGEEAGIIAARKRLQVIMVPSNYLYFNQTQDKSASGNSANTLERVYGYNPDPAILSPADCRNIYGVQAALWTEDVPDEITAEKMTFPRLCALSEVAWTMPENMDYSNFLKRLNTHYDFLDKALIGYYVLKPTGVGKGMVFTDQTQVNLANEFGKGKIYYTTDGSEPTIHSRVYTRALEFNQSATLKAKVIVNKIAESNTLTCNVIKQNLVASQQVADLIPGLNLNYFEGIIDSLVRWNKMRFVKSASISDFSIPDFARADSFGIVIEGYIRIPEDGIYTFATSSDDGSWLFLNDALLVNNDGCHGPSEIEKQIALKKGYHKIKVQYFEALYGNALSGYIRGANLPYQLIPASMLFRSK